jgi:hypothetical protein
MPLEPRHSLGIDDGVACQSWRPSALVPRCLRRSIDEVGRVLTFADQGMNATAGYSLGKAGRRTLVVPHETKRAAAATETLQPPHFVCEECVNLWTVWDG